MIIYNRFIPFDGYRAVSIWPFIFSREKSMKPNVVNHEKTHLRQQFEVLVVSFCVILCLIVACRWSLWWVLTSFLVFYVIYGVEYLVRWILYRDTDEAYENISFEQEATMHEKEADYLSKRRGFEWISYLNRKTYEKG